jgi:hypothetical protein
MGAVPLAYFAHNDSSLSESLYSPASPSQPQRHSHLCVHSQVGNVTRDMVSEYIKLCAICVEKKRKPKGIMQQVMKPILVADVNDRGVLDLIDMRSQPDGMWQWIGRYMDSASEASWVFALVNKTARRVAVALLPILAHVGAPLILQCDNGTEFMGEVIAIITFFSPGTKIINGAARKPWVCCVPELDMNTPAKVC